jgi:ELWxxDGT repeat protein/probable HAF family extracellular repeat protein
MLGLPSLAGALENRCLLSATLVRDVNPGPADSSPDGLVNVQGQLFFAASDGSQGVELWKSDGTTAGTRLVKDVNPGAADSDLANLTAVNGTLFFTADDGTHGRQLWKSDGTAAGTVLVADVNPGLVGSAPYDLTVVGSHLFFAADDGTHGTELWDPPIPPSTPGEHLSQYSIIDLGTLGGIDATPTGINDRGQVVGLSATVTGDTHAFLWQVGHMTDLGTLGGTFSEAYIINAEGEIAGGATTPGGDEHPVVWKDCHIIDLIPNAPAGEGGLATAVNDRGQVVGQLYFPDGSGHAFYYDPRVGLIDLHGQVTLGGNVDAFWDINNWGQMVGLSATHKGDSHAILFDASGLHDLGTLVGTWSEGSRINEAGQISGNAGYDPTQHCPAMPMALCTDQFIHSHAFLYSGGVMHDLGAVPGATWSQGTWVDAHGRVFGGSIEFPTDPGAPEDGKASATLWDHGSITDLNTLLVNPPPTLYPNNLGTVEWGNSRGQLVAWGVLAGTDPDEEFHNHAFLLTPRAAPGEPDARAGLHADASDDRGGKLSPSEKNGRAAENLGGIGWSAAEVVFALLADEAGRRKK